MAMDAQQRARLQKSAIEERNTTIETFLRDRIFPMIRLGKWTEPTNPAKWPHYDDFRKVTGEYWERKDGRTITARKASFQTLVWEVFLRHCADREVEALSWLDTNFHSKHPQ